MAFWPWVEHGRENCDETGGKHKDTLHFEWRKGDKGDPVGKKYTVSNSIFSKHIYYSNTDSKSLAVLSQCSIEFVSTSVNIYRAWTFGRTYSLTRFVLVFKDFWSSFLRSFIYVELVLCSFPTTCNPLELLLLSGRRADWGRCLRKLIRGVMIIVTRALVGCTW